MFYSFVLLNFKSPIIIGFIIGVAFGLSGTLIFVFFYDDKLCPEEPARDCDNCCAELKSKIMKIIEDVDQNITDIAILQSDITQIQSDILIQELETIHATGTITLANVQAGDTVTINGFVFTAVTGLAADMTEFSIDGDDVTDAAELSNTINARHPDVITTSVANVVTLTAIQPGSIGSSITLSETSVAMVLSGPTLAGGVDAVEIKLKDQVIQNEQDIAAIKAHLGLP